MYQHSVYRRRSTTCVLVGVIRCQDAKQVVPDALTKFGTHVKKKEHKLYGAFSKDVDMGAKSTKTTFDDSDDE